MAIIRFHHLVHGIGGPTRPLREERDGDRYCLFADIHDYLAGGRLDPRQLESWPADDDLARMRYEYRDRRGRLGHFAVRFTEGGYCSLYSTGMCLKGTGELNDRIARVRGRLCG